LRSFDHPAERLVAEDQAVASWRRLPVLSLDDLVVRAVDADGDGFAEDGALLDRRFVNLDELRRIGRRRPDGQRPNHLGTSSRDSR
jgi:hypothetical protein